MTVYKVRVRCEKDNVEFFDEPFTVEASNAQFTAEGLTKVCDILKNKLIEAIYHSI